MGIIGQRVGITPGYILIYFAIHPGRPIVRLSLVGAQGTGLARREEIYPNVLARQVVAGRKASLEDQPRPTRFGECLSVEFHPHVTRTLTGVDVMVGVAGVGKDLLLLLVPGIHRLPLEGYVIRKPLTLWPGDG